MTELYTMQRYLQYPYAPAAGDCRIFDCWAFDIRGKR